SRDGTTIKSPNTTGDATIRLLPSFEGLRPSARHNSRPVAGSCPVTTSPPDTTISAPLATRESAGVVYASGDSERARVGRSVRHIVLPSVVVTRSKQDGASVVMPCSTCTYSAPSNSRGDDP